MLEYNSKPAVAVVDWQAYYRGHAEVMRKAERPPEDTTRPSDDVLAATAQRSRDPAKVMALVRSIPKTLPAVMAQAWAAAKYLVTVWDFDGVHIGVLNPNWYGDPLKSQQALVSASRRAPGQKVTHLAAGPGGVEYVITHEFGHAVESYIRMRRNRVDDWRCQASQTASRKRFSTAWRIIASYIRETGASAIRWQRGPQRRYATRALRRRKVGPDGRMWPRVPRAGSGTHLLSELWQ